MPRESKEPVTRLQHSHLLADEFLSRICRGEHPPLSEYTDQNPELANVIRELFPVLLEIEDARPGSESGSADGNSTDGPAALPSMKELGDYRIIREAGRGGMGIVYEALRSLPSGTTAYRRR